MYPAVCLGLLLLQPSPIEKLQAPPSCATPGGQAEALQMQEAAMVRLEDLIRLAPSTLRIFMPAIRNYTRLLAEQLRLSSADLLSRGERTEAARGFEEGARTWLRLMEEDYAFVLLPGTAAPLGYTWEDVFTRLSTKPLAFRMGFMVALEKGAVWAGQRPLLDPASGILGRPELRFPGPLQAPGALDSAPGSQSRFREGVRLLLKVRPQWVAYEVPGHWSFAEHTCYESGFYEAAHGTGNAPMTQGAFDALRAKRPATYVMGLFAGLEARRAFDRHVDLCLHGEYHPAVSPAEVPFRQMLLGASVPASWSLPSPKEAQGRTLIDLLGLAQLEACVVNNPKAIPAIRRLLTEGRCEPASPLHRPPAFAHGYFICVDGRTLPFKLPLSDRILETGGFFFALR